MSITLAFPHAARQWTSLAAVAAASLLLAGCEMNLSNLSASASRPRIAETEAPDASFSENIASLSDVVKRNPNLPEPYNTRGAAYARAGRYQDAITDFSQAIRLDPNHASAYTNRALAERQIGRNDLALADFGRAISANPGHAPAYLGRANLLRAQGSLQEAMVDLDQAIRLNPPSMRVGSSTSATATMPRRSPTSTTPSTAIPSPQPPIRRVPRA